MPRFSGRYPSGQRGQTVNLLAYAFGGSNPPLPTIVAMSGCTGRNVGGLVEVRVDTARARTRFPGGRDTARATTRFVSFCGNSSAVERQPSKLGVAGSNPVSRSRYIEHRDGSAGPVASVLGYGGPVGAPMGIDRAHVAQLAEHALGKGEVSGSIPDMGSRYLSPTKRDAHGR